MVFSSFFSFLFQLFPWFFFPRGMDELISDHLERAGRRKMRRHFELECTNRYLWPKAQKEGWSTLHTFGRPRKWLRFVGSNLPEPRKGQKGSKTNEISKHHQPDRNFVSRFVQVFLMYRMFALMLFWLFLCVYGPNVCTVHKHNSSFHFQPRHTISVFFFIWYILGRMCAAVHALWFCAGAWPWNSKKTNRIQDSGGTC